MQEDRRVNYVQEDRRVTYTRTKVDSTGNDNKCRLNLHRKEGGSTCTGHKQDQPAQDRPRLNLLRRDAGSTY